MPEPSILDARLAEIDRRLRTIQTDLAPLAAGPGDPPHPPATERPPHDGAAPSWTPPVPPPRLRAAPPPPEEGPADSGHDHRGRAQDGRAGAGRRPGADRLEGLIAQLRDLSDAHERLLDLHRELLSQYATLLERGAAVPGSASIAAGPFADGAAVRAFQHALSTLPGVESVDVREYLADDRVVFEARLAAGGATPA
jgi:hypothetical protein